MGSDFIYIGSTPRDETCEQVGPGYDPRKARLECLAFRDQLLRAFGTPPEGCYFYIKKEFHDFGSYKEVVCRYSSEAGAEYAFNVEANSPAKWDDAAILFLKQKEVINA